MKNVKVVLFDFFGVLSTPCYYPIIRTHVKKSSREKLIKMLDDLDIGSLSEDELVAKISTESNLTSIDINNMADTICQLNYDLINFIKDNLSRNTKVGLLTNIPSSRLKKIFSDYLNIFPLQFISSELKMIKPNKDIFEYAIKNLGISPQEILFIDDKQENIDVAKSLGICAFKHEDNIKTFSKLKRELKK